jgi:hypothetical protein
MKKTKYAIIITNLHISGNASSSNNVMRDTALIPIKCVHICPDMSINSNGYCK